jgi:ligand-binding sensor domain-containing protein/DNA-binding NarL/FixJ family response regulator
VVALLCLFGILSSSVVPLTAQKLSTRPLAPAESTHHYAQPLRFSHLGTNEGLANQHVPAILQDRQGFLWFGTDSGLSRFDGYTFVTYQNDPEDPESLSDSGINTLYEDPQGYLWVGTTQGLNRFDPATETFIRYVPDIEDPRSLSSPRVQEIAMDGTGALWVGTLGGLNRLEPDGGGFERFLHNEGDGASLSNDLVWAVYTDSRGALWVGTSGGLDRFDPATGGFIHHGHEPGNPQSLSHNVVTNIYEDRAGNFWVGTEGGLNRFDPQAGIFARFQHDPGDPHSISSNVVRATLEDSQGNLWVATDGGLNLFDRETGHFSRYQPEPGNPYSLNDISLLTLYEDRAGALWIGTITSGVNRLDPQANQFVHYFYNPSADAGLSSNVINQIYEDREGFIWIASPEGGLNRLDPQTGRFTHYRHDPADPRSLGSDQLAALYEDPQRNLWVGTWGAGLSKFNRETGDFTHYRHDPDDPNSLSTNLILRLAGDGAGGLWIGTWGGGLNHFDPATETFTRYRYNANDPTSIGENRIVAIYRDEQDGSLWIGLVGIGLDHFDPATGIFTHYQHDPNDPHSITPGSVLEILQDSAGTLWIGTTGGLNRLDTATGQFTRFTVQDGLPSNYINSMVEDRVSPAQGGPHLWIGTDSGLSRFSPSSQEFRNYDRFDGLQSLNFRPLARLRSRDGLLYVGGDNGFNVFDPAELTANPYIPRIVLTDFQIFNQPVPIGADSPLQRHISLADSITLRHDQSVFSIEFAALNFSAPQKNQYAYRMEGVDRDWVYVDSNRRFVTYTSLRPGQYTFQVKGSNNSGVWNEEGVRLLVTVVPPWWETWAFRLALGTLLVGLSFGGVYIRTSSIRQRNRELAAQVAIRTQELRESEALLNETQQLAQLGGWALHLSSRQLTWTDQVAHIFGLPPEHAPNLNEVLHYYIPDHQPLIRSAVEQGVAEGVPWDLELEIITAQGERRWTRNIGRAEWQDGQIVRLTGTFQDITVLKKSEERAMIQQRRLAMLEERERIGRELHDNLGQVMGYVNMQAQTALEFLGRQRSHQAESALTDLVNVAQSAQHDVREYILGIRRDPSAKESFQTILQSYLDLLRQRYGVTVALGLPDPLPARLVSADAEIQLLRILQEALTNVARHAQVQSAQLTLEMDEGWVTATVEDKGRGFTPHDAVSAETGDHFGLSIMEERAISVGGGLAIHSAPGQGTRITVHLPRFVEQPSPAEPEEPEVQDEDVRALRVMLVDDHPLFLEGMYNMLNARGVQVVGMAHDGDEALALAHQLRPEVILMDVNMPGCDGVTATRRILSTLPEIKIVMLTVAAEEETLFAALKNGASGYLLKSLDSATLFDMLADLMQGQVVISPGLASRVLQDFAQKSSPGEANSPSPNAAPDTNGDHPAPSQAEMPEPILTERQIEVLQLAAEGLSYKEIGQRLYIVERTVKYHMSQILERLHVKNRKQATRYALREGLIDNPALFRIDRD